MNPDSVQIIKELIRADDCVCKQTFSVLDAGVGVRGVRLQVAPAQVAGVRVLRRLVPARGPQVLRPRAVPHQTHVLACHALVAQHWHLPTRRTVHDPNPYRLLNATQPNSQITIKYIIY